MLIRVKAPQGLMDVSNGRLRKVDSTTNTYHWFVSNPINNYGVNVSVADYAHFSEKYPGEKGPLDCDYYESVKLALAFTAQHAAPGATVIVDDYGTWPGAKTAVHEWLNSVPVKIKMRTLRTGPAVLRFPE